MLHSPRSFICLAILFILHQQSSGADRTLHLVDFHSNVKRENTQYGLLPPDDSPLHRSRRQVDEAKELANKFQKKDPWNTTDLPEFPEEISNEQLEKFNKNASIFTDHYTYYNVTYINQPGTVDQYWVNMKDSKDSVRHEMLSNAHRRAATVRLSFKFPFYGYKVENITIATGGFLFLGEAVHTWSVFCLFERLTFPVILSIDSINRKLTFKLTGPLRFNSGWPPLSTSHL